MQIDVLIIYHIYIISFNQSLKLQQIGAMIVIDNRYTQYLHRGDIECAAPDN